MTGVCRFVAIVLRLCVIFPLTLVGSLINSAVNSLADFCIWIEDHA